VFERADALLHEVLANGGPRRGEAASNFVLRTGRRAGWGLDQNAADAGE
jgi:hypothetical protein